MSANVDGRRFRLKLPSQFKPIFHLDLRVFSLDPFELVTNLKSYFTVMGVYLDSVKGDLPGAPKFSVL